MCKNKTTFKKQLITKGNKLNLIECITLNNLLKPSRNKTLHFENFDKNESINVYLFCYFIESRLN